MSRRPGNIEKTDPTPVHNLIQGDITVNKDERITKNG